MKKLTIILVLTLVLSSCFHNKNEIGNNKIIENNTNLATKKENNNSRKHWGSWKS